MQQDATLKNKNDLNQVDRCLILTKLSYKLIEYTPKQ
jgi:hypothetical protein